MTKPRPIAERIKAALADGVITLAAMEHAVFPEKDFPRAHRSAVQGGPPGCRMAMVAALKRYRVPNFTPPGEGNASSRVGPWPKEDGT